MITGLNHVTFGTRDLDESFQFYTSVLGMRPILKWATGAYLLAGGFWIALILDEPQDELALSTYSHVAFSVEESDFEKMAERIKAAGAGIWQQNHNEGASLYFLDPDGHKLEIHASDLKARVQHKRLYATPDMQFFIGNDTVSSGKESL
jgi:glutathione S-transferase fosA5